MKTTISETKALARHILASERAENGHAVAQVCDKLGLLLSKIFGVVGFRTLLSRSLALTKTGTSCFDNVVLDENGKLAGLPDANSPEQKALMRDGGVLLMTNLLMLLEVFIGEALAQTILEEAWPASKQKPVSPKNQTS